MLHQPLPKEVQEHYSKPFDLFQQRFFVALFQNRTIIIKQKSATLISNVALLMNTFFYVQCLFFFEAFVKHFCNFLGDVIALGCP
jgi:hypothetical protein